MINTPLGFLIESKLNAVRWMPVKTSSILFQWKCKLIPDLSPPIDSVFHLDITYEDIHNWLGIFPRKSPLTPLFLRGGYLLQLWANS